MKGHLDPEIAAEFQAGLITGHRERTIAAHVASCAECASLTDRLAQVSALLAAAPAPAMPDSLTRRLDQTLAAAAAEVQEPFVITTSVRRPRNRRRVPSLADVFKIRVLAAGAAVLAVLAGAGYGLSLVSGSSRTSTASGAAAGSAAQPGGSRAAAPAAAGNSASGAKRYENGVTNAPPSGPGAASGVINVVPSGVEYRSATLEQQVAAQLAIRSTLRAAPAPAGLAGCVRNVSDRSPLLLVESAHYNGAPATIVVLTRDGKSEALVAGPACTATVSDIIASVLLPPGISTP